MKKFPIIIFSYNRPLHLRRMLLSLENCKDVSKYPVYFFCDGPKNQLDKKKIIKIQKINYVNGNKIVSEETIIENI